VVVAEVVVAAVVAAEVVVVVRTPWEVVQTPWEEHIWVALVLHSRLSSGCFGKH